MDHCHSERKKSLSYKAGLALAALGVVYGDIGTSPLYALKEAFSHSHLPINQENVLGILSLVFWVLNLVISVKYVMLVLKADNKGEGGILALSSLIQNAKIKVSTQVKYVLILLGLFGAALLYGDGIITPAISILSAVEGLSVITPVFNPYILPISLIIIVILFSIQSRGTGVVGRIFGPIMLLWFITIGSIGIYNIVDFPQILVAMNPLYAMRFFAHHSYSGMIVMGSVVLVVTGGEALYSDLGHFGFKPIKMAWFAVVLPCLLLNYFGQAAFLLQNPGGAENPFFLMAPSWALYPLVGISVLAATIASQALISGVFSITMQAVQLGYMPRFLIEHTSENEIGQIYIKYVNRFLMIGAILLVLFFKSSGALAAAYGVAVTATMVITTLLMFFVVRYKWQWSLALSLLVIIPLIVIDLIFLGSNLLKIHDGGWLPLLIGVFGFIYMTTWKKGRIILAKKLHQRIMPLDAFFERVCLENPPRVDGVAIYMNRNLTVTPYSLIHAYEHFKTLHKTIVFMTVITEQIPRVPVERRYTLVKPHDEYCQLTILFGYLEKPNIPEVLNRIKEENEIFDPYKVSYILSKENIFATKKPGMALWREKLFAIQAKNELAATKYFELPKDRVVEIGTQVEI